QFGLPDGYLRSPYSVGWNNGEIDSDALDTGYTPLFSLTAGESRTDQDAGYYRLGSFHGRAWVDTDGDGVQKSGEPVLAGVEVTLWDADDKQVGTDTTADDGTYHFDDLTPGDYRVEFAVPSGYH